MGLLDGPLRSVASILLNVLGGTGTLRQRNTVFNPITNTESATSISWVLKISPPEPYSVGRIDGTLIRTGDAKVLVASTQLTSLGITLPSGPATNTYLDIGTDTWTVVSVNELRSGDLPAAVELQLRR